MSDSPPNPPKNRRSKRRAAIEAANRIKRIAHDDSTPGKESMGLNKDTRKKQRNAKVAPTQKFPFPPHNCVDPSPSLSISISSMSSIPEDLRLSESTNIGSVLPPSSDFTDFDSAILDEEFKRTSIMDREFRRRERLVNSTGPMVLSDTTAYRLSLFSPQTSPFQATRLILTPFADVPTTPMHVYQYRPLAASRSTLSARQRPPSAMARRIRPKTGRAVGRGVKPRQLI